MTLRATANWWVQQKCRFLGPAPTKDSNSENWGGRVTPPSLSKPLSGRACPQRGRASGPHRQPSCRQSCFLLLT